MNRSLNNIVQRRHVSEQIKALKNKAYLGAHTGYACLVIFHQSAVLLAISYQLTFDINTPTINLLQVINAAQHRRFSGAARANNHHDLPTPYREVNTVQHRQAAKALNYILGTYHLTAIRSSKLRLFHTHNTFLS